MSAYLIERLHQDLENHPYIAIALNNLAFNYDYQGRYREAENYYNQALEMKRKLFSSEHPYRNSQLFSVSTYS